MVFILSHADGREFGSFRARERKEAIETVTDWYRSGRSPLTETPDGPGLFCPKFCEIWEGAECIARFVRTPVVINSGMGFVSVAVVTAEAATIVLI